MIGEMNQQTFTFNAFEVPYGNGPLDVRIVIPKSRYMLAAEDESCYYISPVDGLTPHAIASSQHNEEIDNE